MRKIAGQGQCFDYYTKNIDESTFYRRALDRAQFLLQNQVFPNSDEHLIKNLITF